MHGGLEPNSQTERVHALANLMSWWHQIVHDLECVGEGQKCSYNIGLVDSMAMHIIREKNIFKWILLLSLRKGKDQVDGKESINKGKCLLL